MKSLPESPSKHHKILTEDGSIKEADSTEEKNSNYYNLIKPFQMENNDIGELISDSDNDN